MKLFCLPISYTYRPYALTCFHKEITLSITGELPLGWCCVEWVDRCSNVTRTQCIVVVVVSGMDGYPAETYWDFLRDQKAKQHDAVACATSWT